MRPANRQHSTLRLHLRHSLVLTAKRPLGVSITMAGGLKGYSGGKVTLPARAGSGDVGPLTPAEWLVYTTAAQASSWSRVLTACGPPW